MFEGVIEAAEGHVRASAALAPAFRGSEAAFWTAVAANLRRAETDAGRPKCRSAGKTTYRSESVAWGGSATVAVGDRKVLAVAGATIVGFEVELRDLDGRSSMIVQAEGLGGRGRYGCGIFLRDPE